MSIVVSNLSYGYRQKTPTLNGVSMEFRPTELSFIAGASGSGKTTLIRCINGLIPHRYTGGTMSGQVFLDGAAVSSLSLLQVTAHVGTVMQDPERQMVATHATDEIAFGLENLALPREDIYERVRTHANQLGISHLLDRATATLSGGEKQKVAIAGVLVMLPHTLLLDEPLASLDPASSREVMAYFRMLANSGAAVVVSEHRHKHVLQANPNHCMILEKGRVTFEGVASEFPTTQLPERRSIAPSEQHGRVLITLKNVEFKHSEDRWALKNVNLAVREGDIIALLGANGAGKSTLCRHLIGLHKPMEGCVLINGRDTRDMTVAQIARQVGFVFQSPSSMLFEKTVRREIGFGPTNIGLSRDAVDKRVVSAAENAGLADRLDESPFSLSFGEQKRASVASVLALEPRVLVLDEPTAGQDYDNVLRLMNCLTPLRALDALIFATHDLDLVRAYANRCLVMLEGEIVADENPERVLADQNLLERCRLR